MTPFVALLLALIAAEPRVTGLSVAPVADRTEVVILVDGAVTANHFMLDDGRLVIDLTGVPQPPRLDLPDFDRGGVRELRMAPFQPNVARIVIALANRVAYELVSEPGRIRVSFINSGGAFEPWTHSMPGAAAASGSREVVALPVAAPPPPRQQITQQQNVRVTFINEPVGNVLALFSEYAGRTILAAPGIQDTRISAELRDVPWQEALDAILEAYGLRMNTRPSGVMVVEAAAAAGERRVNEPLITRTFQIQYISADSIRAAVQGLLTPNVGRVTVNSASNALLITDVESVVERLAEVIPQLDAKTPQVDITATIAFIDRTTLESLGVVYDLKDSRGSQLNRLVGGFQDTNNDGVLDPGEATTEDIVLLGGNSVAGLGNANYRVAGPALELVTTLVLGRHSLITFLEALQTVSLSDIQAKPVLRTMDHRQASIQVGEETPIRVIDAGAAGGGAQAPRATVEMQQTGVILEVTPHITGNQVLLDLRAERSNVAAAASDIGLVFQTQNATTQVLVNDGETAVIGGLTIIEKTRSRSGIPFLMDLPVIGALFRNETERENKRDLLIMVTPHIVRD
ncbi:MAG: secretin N-terminal domain-containing protein [Gemmatimonadota bacterium]